MKDPKFYTCRYCYKEFEPARRRVQKYCSDSCRSKAHHARQQKPIAVNTALAKSTNDSPIQVPKITVAPKTKVEAVSMAGITNAAIGSLTADGIKSALTNNSNKAATKGDIQLMLQKLEARYLLVHNLSPNQFGQYPYYDVDEMIIKYFHPSEF